MVWANMGMFACGYQCLLVALNGCHGIDHIPNQGNRIASFPPIQIIPLCNQYTMHYEFWVQPNAVLQAGKRRTIL
jgi:hypothetical protein